MFLFFKNQIYDGGSRDDHVMQTLCGQSVPGYPIVASSNVMLVEFHSDSIIAGAGFNATFNETDC